jgi:hypothetical protein
MRIYVSKASLKIAGKSCRMRFMCAQVPKHYVTEFPEFVRIECYGQAHENLSSATQDGCLHLIRFGENYETIDTMSILTATFRNLDEIIIDSLEYVPGRFMIQTKDLVNQDGKSGDNSWIYDHKYDQFKLKHGTKPVAVASEKNTWDLIDFTTRTYVFDELKQSVQPKEPGSVTHVSPWAIGKFQDYFELDSLWISSDKKHYRMALRYISPETLDLNDIIHYRPVTAEARKLLETESKAQIQEKYGIHIRQFHGKDFMFKYHFEVFEKEKTKDKRSPLYARQLNNSKRDPRIVSYTNQSGEPSAFDTIAVYTPGQVFHLSGDIRSLVMENFFTETSTLRMNTQFFDHEIKHPQNHYRSEGPSPFIRDFTTNDYYALTHEKEQILTDKITYDGHYDAQVEKISYDKKLVTIKITKLPVSDYPNRQQFKLEVICDSDILLDKREIKVPLTIEFKDGSLLNLNYGFKCHWKD